MEIDNIMRSKEVKYKNKEILLNVALSLNKELFDEKKISLIRCLNIPKKIF